MRADGCRQVQGHKGRALVAGEMKQVEREVQDLAAHAAEAHEQALPVVKSHHSAAAVRGLPNSVQNMVQSGKILGRITTRPQTPSKEKLPELATHQTHSFAKQQA